MASMKTGYTTATVLCIQKPPSYIDRAIYLFDPILLIVVGSARGGVQCNIYPTLSRDLSKKIVLKTRHAHAMSEIFGPLIKSVLCLVRTSLTLGRSKNTAGVSSPTSAGRWIAPGLLAIVRGSALRRFAGDGLLPHYCVYPVLVVFCRIPKSHNEYTSCRFKTPTRAAIYIVYSGYPVAVHIHTHLWLLMHSATCRRKAGALPYRTIVSILRA